MPRERSVFKRQIFTAEEKKGVEREKEKIKEERESLNRGKGKERKRQKSSKTKQTTEKTEA